jgi:hypothetical protein
MVVELFLLPHPINQLLMMIIIKHVSNGTDGCVNGRNIGIHNNNKKVIVMFREL